MRQPMLSRAGRKASAVPFSGLKSLGMVKFKAGDLHPNDARDYLLSIVPQLARAYLDIVGDSGDENRQYEWEQYVRSRVTDPARGLHRQYVTYTQSMINELLETMTEFIEGDPTFRTSPDPVKVVEANIRNVISNRAATGEADDYQLHDLVSDPERPEKALRMKYRMKGKFPLSSEDVREYLLSIVPQLSRAYLKMRGELDPEDFHHEFSGYISRRFFDPARGTYPHFRGEPSHSTYRPDRFHGNPGRDNLGELIWPLMEYLEGDIMDYGDDIPLSAVEDSLRNSIQNADLWEGNQRRIGGFSEILGEPEYPRRWSEEQPPEEKTFRLKSLSMVKFGRKSIRDDKVYRSLTNAVLDVLAQGIAQWNPADIPPTFDNEGPLVDQVLGLLTSISEHFGTESDPVMLRWRAQGLVNTAYRARYIYDNGVYRDSFDGVEPQTIANRLRNDLREDVNYELSGEDDRPRGFVRDYERRHQGPEAPLPQTPPDSSPSPEQRERFRQSQERQGQEAAEVGRRGSVARRSRFKPPEQVTEGPGSDISRLRDKDLSAMDPTRGGALIGAKEPEEPEGGPLVGKPGFVDRQGPISRAKPNSSRQAYIYAPNKLKSLSMVKFRKKNMHPEDVAVMMRGLIPTLTNVFLRTRGGQDEKYRALVNATLSHLNDPKTGTNMGGEFFQQANNLGEIGGNALPLDEIVWEIANAVQSRLYDADLLPEGDGVGWGRGQMEQVRQVVQDAITAEMNRYMDGHDVHFDAASQEAGEDSVDYEMGITDMVGDHTRPPLPKSPPMKSLSKVKFKRK